MRKLDASLRIPIDPTNPGQFFSCCGMLELAARIWDEAEGWFDGREFCLAAPKPTRESCATELIRALMNCRLANRMTNHQIARLDELSKMKAAEREKTPGLDEEKKELEKLRRELAIVLYEPFKLQIDWFLDEWSGGSRFKTWAGQQGVLDIALAMKVALDSGRWDELRPDRWLTETADSAGLPFNFDSDLAGQASAIDLGFSMDPLKMASPTRPFIELLAFIGLQRFRPAIHLKENRYTYVLWTTPLSAAMAAVACCGIVPQPTALSFDFPLLYRTKYLKSFLSSQPSRGDRCQTQPSSTRI
jgi:CRISPR-associated protein Csb3